MASDKLTLEEQIILLTQEIEFAVWLEKLARMDVPEIEIIHATKTYPR